MVQSLRSGTCSGATQCFSSISRFMTWTLPAQAPSTESLPTLYRNLKSCFPMKTKNALSTPSCWLKEALNSGSSFTQHLSKGKYQTSSFARQMGSESNDVFSAGLSPQKLISASHLLYSRQFSPSSLDCRGADISTLRLHSTS